MSRPIAFLLVLLFGLSGCMGGTQNDTNEEDPVPGEGPEDDQGVLTGGDPEDDSIYQSSFKPPQHSEWHEVEHHFRIPFQVGESVKVNQEVRFTIDMLNAMQEAGLDWIGPGMPVDQLEADPASVVVHSVSSSGKIQATLEVEARQAGVTGLELAFDHVGGLYYVYFDDVRNEVPGGPAIVYDDGVTVDAVVRRAHLEWQGTDLWGVTTQTGIIKHFAGDFVTMYATIRTNAHDLERQPVPFTYTLRPRVPDDWHNVATDPDDEDTFTGSSKRVRMEGDSPRDGTGSDALFLDVVGGEHTVTITFLIKYHEQ